MNLKKIKKAYNDILSVIEEHKDIVVYDYDILKSQAEAHILNIELIEVYVNNYELEIYI